jgi:YidC/Oxa1 family membrane protein insertase
LNIIFNVLNQILGYLFHFTGDWGATIILLTVVVKLVLMPMSIKQKLGMEKQQNISKKLEEIKLKHKDNEEKIKEESQQYYSDAAKGMLDFMTLLLQLPVIYALFKVITKLPCEAGTVIVPWISSIKSVDTLYILPIIYIVVSCIPSLLPYVPYLKTAYRVKNSKTVLLTNVVFSLMIILKAPIALGMYFITTSLFSIVEEIGFRIYVRHKLASQS